MHFFVKVFSTISASCLAALFALSGFCAVQAPPMQGVGFSDFKGAPLTIPTNGVIASRVVVFGKSPTLQLEKIFESTSLVDKDGDAVLLDYSVIESSAPSAAKFLAFRPVRNLPANSQWTLTISAEGQIVSDPDYRFSYKMLDKIIQPIHVRSSTSLAIDLYTPDAEIKPAQMSQGRTLCCRPRYSLETSPICVSETVVDVPSYVGRTNIPKILQGQVISRLIEDDGVVSKELLGNIVINKIFENPRERYCVSIEHESLIDRRAVQGQHCLPEPGIDYQVLAVDVEKKFDIKECSGQPYWKDTPSVLPIY